MAVGQTLPGAQAASRSRRPHPLRVLWLLCAKGDEIDVETPYGLYRYRMTGSQIVNPDNRTVLVHNSNGYHLTLTTCWPLWAGAFATQRYVIFAEQVWPVTIRPGYT